MNLPRKTCPKCRSKLIYDQDGYGAPTFIIEGHGDARMKIYVAKCSRKGCSNNRHKFKVSIRR